MLIRRETLAAALPACTTDDTRYYLSKVEIRPDGEVRATNGHVAILARDRSPLPDEDFPIVPGAEFHGSPELPVLLDAVTAKRLIGATAKGKRALPILSTVQVSRNGSPNTITIAATDLQAPMVTTIARDEQEKFPDLDRVMPAADKAGTVALVLSSEVLETLLKTARAIQGGKGMQAIRFDIPIGSRDRGKTADPKTGRVTLHEVVSAVRVTMTGADVDVTAVAMPCRM